MTTWELGSDIISPSLRGGFVIYMLGMLSMLVVVYLIDTWIEKIHKEED